MALDPTVTPKIREDLIFRQLDEEWVVYDPNGELLHVLNRTAAVVWLHCTGELSVPQIAEAVADAFEDDLSSDQVAADVAAAVEEFTERGLLQ